MDQGSDKHAKLARKLIEDGKECGWLEFKVNNGDPKEVGSYISALSNSAALASKHHGYLIWGVEDQSRRVMGTTFNPLTAKVGNEDLIPWLQRLVTPKTKFDFIPVVVDGQNLVMMAVERAHRQPTQFEGQEYIRVGSTKKPLKAAPELEAELWRIFEQTQYEGELAATGLSESEVISLLDYPAYFQLSEIPLPEGRSQILRQLLNEQLIVEEESGDFGVTNLGAILFARDLTSFPKLARKAVRVVLYEGGNRVITKREQGGVRGYAAGFENLISFINNLVPNNEVMGTALRKSVPMYPTLTVRELAANALIHQDFRVGGAGPLIEIFDDRMEISNPGTPLVEIDRLMDTPPRSRNERLASLLRRFGMCEERGSGIDKVVFEAEFYQLPPPDFRIVGDNTVAVLYAPQKLTAMQPKDRIRACYQHACLMYVSNKTATNASVRKRFKIEDQNHAMASRIIKETLEAGLIRKSNPDSDSKRHASYWPFWA
ncbi:ATP-binding protein [Achromobacter insolitus]|uniref:ATP-binding protein n=1 Tax=Achromobacter insolitus TaxID=217204 RepID=UPI00174AD567|nr:ATP-binding protein [Achromobacter insolitus]